MHEVTQGRTMDGESVSMENGRIEGEGKGDRESSYYPDPGEGQSKRSSQQECHDLDVRDLDVEKRSREDGNSEIRISGETK